VIPSCGTFDYVTIVPGAPNTDSCPWEVRLRDLSLAKMWASSILLTFPVMPAGSAGP